MDERAFDRLSKSFGKRRLGRRVVFDFGKIAVSSAVGLVAFARPSRGAAQSTPAATPGATADADGFSINGAWFCDQMFALCTTAPCTASASDPAIAVCPCVVETGLSMGFTTCAERAPSGTDVTSTFSTTNANPNFAQMLCPESAPWANCLDMPCTIDPLNPALATCLCEIKTTGPSFTLGGWCRHETCDQVIWSGTTTDTPGVAEYQEAMQRVGQTAANLAFCPNNNSASTPVSA